MSSSRQIKIGALMSYLAIIFNVIAGLIYTPWMVHQIGKSDYGLYILASSFLTYFVMDFGLGQAIARFIAKYRVAGDKEKVNNLLGLTTRLYLYIDLCIFIALVITFFFIENIFKELTTDEQQKFKIIYCIAGLFSLLSFPFSSLNGILIAYERFVLLKLCDLISKILTIVLMVAALFLGYKLIALVAINAGVGILIILIKLFYLSKTTSIKINFKYFDREFLHELFGFSAWVTIIGIAQRLIMNITPTILGIVSGTTQIAIFAIGMTIEGYTWTFASALNGLFLSKVSGIAIKKDNKEDVTQLMIRVGRIQLLVIGLLLIGIITLGKQFVTLWMGNDFENSYYVIILLVIPGFITLTQEIANTMMIVVNKLKFTAVLMIIASIFSVIISVFLSPILGAVGSAIGIFTALILCHVIGMNIVYYNVLKIDIPRFFRECHLKLLFPLSLSLLVGFLINFYIPAHNLITFAPKAVLLGFVYFALMWILGLNISEKQLIRSVIWKVIPKSAR